MDIKSAWLTTNRSCNCRCEWCYAQRTLGPKSYMDFEKAKVAVRELKKHNTRKIVLIGGEPTIYMHFLELVKLIHENGMNCTVATNGILFENYDFASATVKAGVNNINISLKGVSEEDYYKNTGTRGLQKVLKGYQNLKRLKFNPIVSYVIVSDDENEFDKLVELLEKNNVDRVGFQFVKPVVEIYQTDTIMDIRAMANFVEYIYERMKMSDIQYSLEISFPLCLIKKEILEKLITEHKIVTCCHVQKGSGIVFDTDFKVLPCNHFAEYPFKQTPMDFSKEDPIEQLWSSREVTDFREKKRCYPSESCTDCRLWNDCGGGCFTRWLFINPSDYINRK